MHKSYGLHIKTFFISSIVASVQGQYTVQSSQYLNIPDYLVKREPAFLIQGVKEKTGIDNNKPRQNKKV